MIPASHPAQPSLIAALTPFDWLLLLILVWSTIRAFVRGILLELFSFFGFIAGFLLAAWNYPVVASWLAPFLSTRAIADAVAFLLIVISITLLCALLGRALRRTAEAIGLGIPDRLLGALFGLARGALFCAVILLTAAAFFPTASWLANSQLSPCFLTGAHAISFVVPRDLEQRILTGASTLKHTAPDWIKPPR